ncbi:unnamed protein product [Lepeophtheirus salmonis]|uniref:(salmon louse) hypothetical protein n=1 Tax=Lepeophtheirus salmonis TaxID=72036 RepID=A0A7R8CLM5_LEPSM|nr:unnamed protein product [Lepeophtheirus salmonis]CAF2829530.1 unnamed protein product [Lepeophtheirus salmonis]
MINFLRASSSHHHRMLREFLGEVEVNADDLLLHNNLRWFSKGKGLERFWPIRKEIAAFLGQTRTNVLIASALESNSLVCSEHIPHHRCEGVHKGSRTALQVYNC